MTSPTDRQRLAGLRGEILRETANTITNTILDPETDLGPLAFTALEKTAEAAEALIKAATGSNPGYEVDDLPREEREEYKRIVHGLNLLRRLRVE